MVADSIEPKKKICLLIPAYTTIPSTFLINFMKILTANMNKYVVEVVIQQDMPIDKARNSLVESALGKDADYWLWMDTDNILPDNAIDTLIKNMEDSKADLVSALYFEKAKPYYPVIRQYHSGGFWKIENPPLGQVIEIAGCGMGACLVRPDVFKKIPYPWFKFSYETWGHKDIQLSEDLYFCRQMIQAGLKLVCNTGMIASHIGSSVDAFEYMSMATIRVETQQDRDELTADLIKFTGREEKDINLDVMVGEELMAKEWKKSDPKTFEDEKAFYKRTDNYLYDLYKWHFTNRRQFDLELVTGLKNFKNIKTVLDFGCFLDGTQITMQNFTEKNISDIKTNEHVLTHTGKIKKVIATSKRKYDGNVYSFKIRGVQESLKTTEEHPFFVIKRKDMRCRRKGSTRLCKKVSILEKVKQCYACIPKISHPEFIPAKEICIGDYLVTPKPKLKQAIPTVMTRRYLDKYTLRKSKEIPESITFDKKLLRLLGFWLAEGSLLKSHDKIAGIRFSFNINETEYAEEISDTLYDIFKEKAKVIYRPEKTILEVYVCNKRLGLLFNELCGKGCYGKRIHNDIMEMQPKLLLELFKTFYLGDGCLNKLGQNTIKLTTVSKNLRDQLFWIATKNGLPARIWGDTVLLSGNLEEIDPKAQTNHGDKDTHTQIFEYGNYILRPITSIKTTKKSVNVYNLEVEGDNTYVANKVAVHNCGIGQNAIMLAREGFNVTLADLDSKTLDFAEFRFKEHNIPHKVWKTDVMDRPPKKTYDAILCFDVLEHLPKEEMRKVIEKLAKLKHKDTKILYSANFKKTSVHPMHHDMDDEYPKIMQTLLKRSSK